MATEYITADTTRFFSETDLLSCISNPNDQVLLVLPQAFSQAWPSGVMQDFATRYAYIKGDNEGRDINSILNETKKYYDVLQKAQEKTLDAFEFLKSQGLAQVVDYGFQDVGLDILLEKKAFPVSYETPLAHKLKRYYWHSDAYNNETLKLMPADIDVVAYGLANGALCKSSNPAVADGVLAQSMGFEESYQSELESFVPDTITKNDYDFYMGDRHRFLEKHPKMKVVSKIILCASHALASAFIPPYGIASSFFGGGQGIVDILNKAKATEQFAAYQSDVKQTTPQTISTFIEQFSHFRMNVPKKERD